MQQCYKKSIFAKQINNAIYFSEVSIHSKIKKGIVIKYILLTLNFTIGYLRYLVFCNNFSFGGKLTARENCVSI
jgi:hypothetical protein